MSFTYPHLTSRCTERGLSSLGRRASHSSWQSSSYTDSLGLHSALSTRLLRPLIGLCAPCVSHALLDVPACLGLQGADRSHGHGELLSQVHTKHGELSEGAHWIPCAHACLCACLHSVSWGKMNEGESAEPSIDPMVNCSLPCLVLRWSLRTSGQITWQCPEWASTFLTHTSS